MNKFLNYGDVIYLTFPQKKPDLTHYLHGKSILSSHVAAISSKDLLKKGFRKCLFQIFPRNCQFLADNLTENSKNIENFQGAWKNLLEEGIKRHIGSPVLYGDSVHLLHIETRSFLANETINKNENSGQSCRLFLTQEISQEKTCFQFETVSNYFYPGEKISYNTNILVKHANTSYYLTFLTEERRNSFKSTNSDSSFSLAPANELTMNPLPITMVEVTPYTDPQKSKNYKDSNFVLNGDFVRIYDLRLVRENLQVHKFYLEPRDSYMSEEDDALILNYYSNNLSSNSSNKIATNYNSNSVSAVNVFQILVPDELDQQEAPIKLLPKGSYQEGSKYKFIKKDYLLKHVLSSSYVMNPSANDHNPQIKLDLKTKDYAECLDKYRVSLFKLSGKEGSLVVNANFLVGDYSAQKDELLFIAQSTEEDPERIVKTIAFVDKVSAPELSVMYYKDDRLLAENYNTFLLKWDRESSLSESLRCEKISEDESYDLNFFLASNELLTRLNRDLESYRKNVQKDYVDCFVQITKTVEKIKDVTVKILMFVTERKLDGDYVHNDKFVPSIMKQSYLKEFKTIETLNGIILKLSLVAAHYQELPITSDKRFEDLMTYFTYLLKLYMLNNPVNTNDLMRSVKIYLRSELMQRLTSVVTEVLNHSEYASLNLIMEILKLFIYDKSSNNYTKYSPHSELSVKVLRILIAVSKFKSFCIALQRYRNFWSPQFIMSVFPRLVMNSSTNVLEVHYKDTHLMNLIDITTEGNASIEASYVMDSLNLITILSKKLPNFQRLYKALKDFIPYEVCLEVIKYSQSETYSFTMKKLMLELIVNFHFRYFLSQTLLWPYQFIKASNVNLPNFTDLEAMDQMLQSTNALPQKLTLINIFNLYNKKVMTLINDSNGKLKGSLREILDILQFSSIFFKNGIIEFQDKKPFLILYQGYSNLNKKLEAQLKTASKLKPEEEAIVAQIRQQFKEIQISINQAIETFFAKEYLQFLSYKYSFTEGATSIKTALQHLQATLNNSRSLDPASKVLESGSKTEIPSRNDLQASKSLRRGLTAGRKPSISAYITSPNKSDDFIEINLEEYKFEEDLKEFLVAWDKSLEPYTLGLKQIVDDQLTYIDNSKMTFQDIISLQELSSRFKSLTQHLRSFVILENNNEVTDITRMFNLVKGVSEMIETFAKDNSINTQLFDNAEKDLQKVLHQLGIDTSIIQNAELTSDNILLFLIENQTLLDTSYQLHLHGRNDTSIEKYQDAMRILKIYDKLLDILDYFVTSTNEYYMPRTLKCRLYVVQLLSYFILNHSENCNALHKLLVTAYFYEIYSGKTYTPDVVVYMQTLVASLFRYSAELLQNENEIKRLHQIFYEPYLRSVIDLNDKQTGSFPVSLLNSPKSSPQQSPVKGLALGTPVKSLEPNGLSTLSPKNTNIKINIQRVISNNQLKVPTDPQIVAEKASPIKNKTALIMCSFTLNSIQAFFKTSSKPLLAKFQGQLQDLFYLNSEVFRHYITDTNKYKFEDEELETVWVRFYQNLIKSCSEFTSNSNAMLEYLLSSFGTMSNLNGCILKVKKHNPYSLKAELIHLGTLLFPSFEATEENNKAKLEFLLILVYEAYVYIALQLGSSQIGSDLQKRDVFLKSKTLQIWEDIRQQHDVNLIAKLEALCSSQTNLHAMEKIQDQIQQNVFGNIIKFFKHLFKYNPPFCLSKLETVDSKENLAVMDIMMGVLNEILEVSKLYGHQEKVNLIRNNLLNEIKINKDYGKFHHQMKVVDFLLAFETPALLNGDDNASNVGNSSVSNIFETTIDRFLNEENIKVLESDSFMLLVRVIKDHPTSERILKQILEIVESGQYCDMTKKSYFFFCYLIRELLKNKVLTLEEKVVEIEYRIPHIKLVQNLFNQYGFTEFLFKNMVECTEENLLIFMEMANYLLYGGYHKIQKSFFDCFMSDHENKLILKLNAQLKKIYEKVMRKEKIRNTANQMLLIKKKLKNDHLKHKDDNDALLLASILQFIHLLCENHNTEFQQFFKEQNHEKKLTSISINFPIELCQSISSYIEVCNYYSYTIGHELFGALIEIVQGDCRDIIFEICNRTSIVNDILIFLHKYQTGTDIYKGRRFEGNNVIENLKSDAINLLLSIVESSDSQTKDIIAEEIDYMLLIKATLNFLNSFFKKAKIGVRQSIETLLKIRDEQFVAQGGLSDGLNLLIIIKVLERSSTFFKTEIMNRIQDCDEAARTDFQFYMEELGGKFIQSIEILDPNKNLRKIYFSKLPSCFHLNQNIKDEVIERIDRTAYHVKISEFLGDPEEMHYKMKAQMDLALNPRFMLITQLYPKLKFYSYALAYIINILMTLYFENEDLDIIYADSYLRWNSYFYVFLNFVQLVLSFSILIVWFGTNEPKFYLSQKWHAFNKLNCKKSKPITYEEEQRWHLKPDSITVQDYIRILHLKGPNARELKDSTLLGLNIPEVQYEYIKNTLGFLFHSSTFINNLLYVLNCWLSLVVHPIFCSMQLLNSLAESKIMQSVISCFYKNATELGITLGGCVIIVFIYSLVGFFFLRESFVIDGYENVCSTIWHCFISLLDFGMRSGGGIGDVLSHESYIHGNTKMFTGRWFYDISFYFLIIVVMLNLIFGIVIDTFSNIRTEKIENQEDQEGKCFICDIDRGMLERVGSGFEEHAKNEHHMWDYIFYLIHVKTKGITNLSEIEDYVYKSIKNKDYSWIPYKKALCMRGRGGVDEMERDVDEIKDKVQKMEAKLDKYFSHIGDKKKKEDKEAKKSMMQ